MKGDTLASGSVRASWGPQDSKITKAQWDEIFNEYNPEEYRRYAGSKTARDGGVSPRTDQTNARK